MSDKRKEIWETLDAGLTKWMSKAYATGQSDERERIIKLLEGYQGLTGMFALERDDLIALIKGVKNGNV